MALPVLFVDREGVVRDHNLAGERHARAAGYHIDGLFAAGGPATFERLERAFAGETTVEDCALQGGARMTVAIARVDLRLAVCVLSADDPVLLAAAEAALRHSCSVGQSDAPDSAISARASTDHARVAALARTLADVARTGQAASTDETLLDALDEGVLVVEPQQDGPVVSRANAAAIELLGLPDRREYRAVLGEAGLEGCVRACVERGGHSEHVLERPNGGARIVAIDVRPCPGLPGASIVVLRDVTTERERTEAQAYAAKMDAIGRLAGGVAHEFNNMLTAISGFSDLLLEELVVGDPKRGDVEQIKEASDRATELTRKLLAFGGRQVLQPQTVDVAGLVRSAVPRLRRVLGRGHQLEIDLPDTPLYVQVDPEQLDHVLDNLVSNAVDAMLEGGKLEIRVRRRVGERDRATGEEDHVELAVSDTGVGMDAATANKAFEPFFSTRRPRRHGLGLSSVYGIVRQSGGHVAIDATVGVGATVKVRLPVCVAPLRAHVPVATLSPGRRTETILVVEDEEVVRLLTAQVLRRAGFSVIEAENGREALDRANAFPGRIDLLLSDVMMPGETGPEVATALLARRPDTRVLFMSGYTEDSEVLRALREKRLELLRKPFTTEALVTRVSGMLDEMLIISDEPPPTKR